MLIIEIESITENNNKVQSYRPIFFSLEYDRMKVSIFMNKQNKYENIIIKILAAKIYLLFLIINFYSKAHKESFTIK